MYLLCVHASILQQSVFASQDDLVPQHNLKVTNEYTSVSDPDPDGSALKLTPWIRIRIRDADSGSGSWSFKTEKWKKLNIIFKISLTYSKGL